MNDKTEWMNKKADRTDSAKNKVREAMRLLSDAVNESDKDDLAHVLSSAHLPVDELMVAALKRHHHGKNLMAKAIDGNDGYIGNDPVAMVERAVHLLCRACSLQEHNGDNDQRNKMLSTLADCRVSVDHLMVGALKLHRLGLRLMRETVGMTNDGPQSPEESVKSAVELLNSAVKAANANPDHDSRTKALNNLTIELRKCDNEVDYLMVDSLKTHWLGQKIMRDAVGESSPKPDQLTVSDRMVLVIRYLYEIMMDDTVLAHWANRDKQDDSLETLIDQFNEGSGNLEKEFLAIALTRTTEGRQFMKQALESFIESPKKEVTPEEALGDVVDKIDDAIDRLNDALRDSRVPCIDYKSKEGSDDPLAEFLIKRICERSCGTLDVYFSNALANSNFGRRVIKHLIND